MLTRYDKALIYFLLLLASLTFAMSVNFANIGRAGGLAISVYGREVGHYSLYQSRKVKVQGRLGISVVEISGSKVRILSSPCPRKECMARGWISKPGEVIVCAPNEVVVKIVGSDEGKPIDAVSK
ncbi:MAG: NusG domain II-containing protein [Actinomycetota bacterium]